MKDIIRDSTVGQFLNSASGGRILPYADQKPEFVFPDHSQANWLSRTNRIGWDSTSTTPPQDLSKEYSPEKHGSKPTLTAAPDVENVRLDSEVDKKVDLDLDLVDWYGPNDPDNPRFVESM